uniref:Cytochrome b n=1 Tax=Cajanus cajan TaxID=3821 RepID=A0A151UEY2_CAJCA
MTIRNQRFSLLKEPISSTLNQHLIDYPTPSNLSYWWGFGSLAGICLVIQIVTGVFLAMHYTPHVDLAFNSVEHVMRDVEGGWLLRYMHANGASMFLIVVHLHIFRGLYHASYSSPREFVRCLGVVIFLLMIVTAFTGYVLPWEMDQISFYPYFYVKDLVGWVAFAIFFSIWIFYAPNHQFLYVCWLYLFLKVCTCVVQVFALFTKEYFGCFWRIAYY